MGWTRRGFLKMASAATAGLVLMAMDLYLSSVEAYARELRTRDTREIPTICCYCAVGCGIICHTDKKTEKEIYTEKVTSTTRINGGALCAEGSIRLPACLQ